MRASLMDAAVALVAESGAGAVSIDNVIRHAGVARGTFYNYFTTPADLMQSVGVELTEDLITTVDQIVRRHDDPAARVAIGLRAILACARASRVLAALIMQSGWPIAPPDHALRRLVAGDVARGLETSRFRPTPIAVAMALVGGLVVGTMPVYAEGVAPPDLDAQITETLLIGLGLSPDEASRLARVSLPPVLPRSNGLLARMFAGVG